MKRIISRLLMAAIVVVPGVVVAQNAAPAEDAGRVVHGYTLQNTVDFGGRITHVSGNRDMYNSMENLQSGPRLLDQSLTARPLQHEGSLFDELWLTSYGYGGDPQAGSRLRVYKSKLYEFNAVYRHDENYFNDNYLGNPYNTPGGYVVWNQAIHQMNTRRNMGDFHLSLMPESAVRLRLDFGRNNNHGFSLSSLHEGTDISLLQDVQSRQDQYHAGVDIKLMPRTILSYDQFYDHNKSDTIWSGRSTGEFYYNSGTTLAPVYTPVNIGAIYNTYYGQPCANTPTPIITVVGGKNVIKTGTGSSACSLNLSYHRAAPSRANFPTEKLSLISNSWKKLNVHATGSYSSAENKTNFAEATDDYEPRTNSRGGYITGPGKVRQVSANADLGATLQINEAWSVSNQLQYTNWRIPGTWNMTSSTCGPVGAASILSPVGTLGNPGCALTGSTNVNNAATGSVSSYTNDAWSLLHKDKRLSDTTLLSFEHNRAFAAHAGFRYGTRTVAYGNFTTGTTTTLAPAPVPPTPATVASADTSNAFYPETDHEKTGLFGVRLRPTDPWMINADAELTYIDHPVAALLPGHSQLYRVRSNYRLGKRGTIAGFVSWKESRNSEFSSDFTLANINTNPILSGTGSAATWVASPVAPVRHKDHNINYGLSASLHPVEKVTLDFGWTYQDLYSTGGVCIPMTLAIVPEGGQISRCPAAAASGTLYDNEGDPYSSYNGVPAVLRYQQNTNTAYINVTVKPVQRVSLLFGYDLTSTDGSNNWYRADTMAPFRVPVDASGNVIYAGNTLSGARVGYAMGPNPDVGAGPLAMAWHLPQVGVELGLTKSLAFKGIWHYYDYHEQNDPYNYIASRNFKANTGTLSLRYSF